MKHEDREDARHPCRQAEAGRDAGGPRKGRPPPE